MLRTLILVLMMLTASAAAASDAIVIESECIMLEDIFPGIGIKDEVYCGLDYGEEKVVNRQMTLYIINKHSIAGARPGEVTFRRKGTLLTEDRLKSDIEDLISVMYGDLEVEVSGIRMGRSFYYSYEKGYDLKLPKNRFGNVSVSVDNGKRKFNYTVNLKAFKEVYVARTSIKRGEDINGKVSMERVDLSKIRGEAITETQGYIASRNISSGKPVTAAQVIRKPDAFKGSSVRIVYQDGALKITTGGELLEDAYIGKNVRVKNTTSGKIVRGEYASGRKVVVNNQ